MKLAAQVLAILESDKVDTDFGLTSSGKKMQLVKAPQGHIRFDDSGRGHLRLKNNEVALAYDGKVIDFVPPKYKELLSNIGFEMAKDTKLEKEVLKEADKLIDNAEEIYKDVSKNKESSPDHMKFWFLVKQQLEGLKSWHQRTKEEVENRRDSWEKESNKKIIIPSR